LRNKLNRLGEAFRKIMNNSDSVQPSSTPKHIVCVGAVVRKADQVLLVRQAQGHPLEGQWSVPWGYVDEEEFPDEAAIRETLEESGIEAEVVGLLGIQELHDQGWIAIAFECSYIDGVPKPDSKGETDKAKFYSLEEIEALDEPIEPWCAWIVRRVLEGGHKCIPYALDNPYAPLRSFL
jgi:ADP-ribose pyrophosphatase YjhB (NUDIX family)